MATSTPWGAADYSRSFARGVVFYSTPSHGGFHLSPVREAELDERLQAYGVSAERARMGYPAGWYEEDCSALAVRVGFPELFPDMDGVETFEEALEGLLHWIGSYEGRRAL